MFAEGGDPCFEHNGEGMCVYSVGNLYGSTCNEQGCTLWTGACDLNAAGCNTDAGENPTHAHNAEKEGQEQGQGADDGS